MRRMLGYIFLLLAFAGNVSLAQETAGTSTETEIDALEPAVSSEELTEELAQEREELEPAVPSAVLAGDVRRRTIDNRVMDEMDLSRTEITGNQELPKVLYIVPWQKSDPGALAGKPVNTLLDEALAPIDRTEFIRQVEYYGDLYEGNEEE